MPASALPITSSLQHLDTILVRQIPRGFRPTALSIESQLLATEPEGGGGGEFEIGPLEVWALCSDVLPPPPVRGFDPGGACTSVVISIAARLATWPTVLSTPTNRTTDAHA